jgi:2-dehydropantoate 2-reductase
VVYAASTVIAPGVIELENASPRVVLGEADNRETQRIQAIAAHINGGGMQAIVSTKIRDEIWNKLLGNLGNGPLTVLTQVSMKELFQDQLCVDAALRVMAEAQAVANALGAHPSGNHEKRIEHSKGIDHKPSILQDLELGRPMEIDGIFDAPLELARMVGVPTPTLDLLVAMAKVRARAAGLYQG